MKWQYFFNKYIFTVESERSLNTWACSLSVIQHQSRRHQKALLRQRRKDMPVSQRSNEGREKWRKQRSAPHFVPLKLPKPQRIVKEANPEMVQKNKMEGSCKLSQGGNHSPASAPISCWASPEVEVGLTARTNLLQPSLAAGSLKSFGETWLQHRADPQGDGHKEPAGQSALAGLFMVCR